MVRLVSVRFPSILYHMIAIECLYQPKDSRIDMLSETEMKLRMSSSTSSAEWKSMWLRLLIFNGKTSSVSFYNDKEDDCCVACVFSCVNLSHPRTPTLVSWQSVLTCNATSRKTKTNFFFHAVRLGGHDANLRTSIRVSWSQVSCWFSMSFCGVHHVGNARKKRKKRKAPRLRVSTPKEKPSNHPETLPLNLFGSSV